MSRLSQPIASLLTASFALLFLAQDLLRVFGDRAGKGRGLWGSPECSMKFFALVVIQMRRFSFSAGLTLSLFLVLVPLHADSALPRGRVHSEGRVLVDMRSPAELKENPALIQDHPLGVILGTVTVTGSGEPLPDAMVVLTTVPLVRRGSEITLDRNALSWRVSYVSTAFTDSEGKFAFYYVPLEYVSGQLHLVVFADGCEPVIREQVVAVRGQATRVDVEVMRRE